MSSYGLNLDNVVSSLEVVKEGILYINSCTSLIRLVDFIVVVL